MDVKKRTLPLSDSQAQAYAEKMPQVLQAALEDRSLTGLDVALTGVKPEELCFPLTAQQLAAIRACVSLSRKELEVVRIPDSRAERRGVLLLRVRYDYAGNDADGNAVCVLEEGAIGLLCGSRGGDGFRSVMSISDVEKCSLTADGGAHRPGWLKRTLRRWLRRKGREGIGDTALELAGDLLEFAVEFVLEVVFDG